MLALSTVMVVDTYPMGLWDGFTPGPAFFPTLIAAATSVLAVILLVGGLGAADEASNWPEPPALRRVAVVYGALLAFFAAVPLLGMLPSATLLLAFITIVVFRQPLKGSLAAVAVTVGFVYLIFVQWLAIPLPKGVFGT